MFNLSEVHSEKNLLLIKSVLQNNFFSQYVRTILVRKYHFFKSKEFFSYQNSILSGMSMSETLGVFKEEGRRRHLLSSRQIVSSSLLSSVHSKVLLFIPEGGGRESRNVTFHEQQKCVYDFPSLSLATRASASMLELVFKQEWQSF